MGSRGYGGASLAGAGGVLAHARAGREPRGAHPGTAEHRDDRRAPDPSHDDPLPDRVPDGGARHRRGAGDPGSLLVARLAPAARRRHRLRIGGGRGRRDRLLHDPARARSRPASCTPTATRSRWRSQARTWLCAAAAKRAATGRPRPAAKSRSRPRPPSCSASPAGPGPSCPTGIWSGWTAMATSIPRRRSGSFRRGRSGDAAPSSPPTGPPLSPTSSP